MIELRWIESPGGVLLWAHLLLIWSIVNYATFRDPTGVQEVELAEQKRRLPRWSW